MPIRSDDVIGRIIYPSGVMSKEVFLNHLPFLSECPSLFAVSIILVSKFGFMCLNVRIRLLHMNIRTYIFY